METVEPQQPKRQEDAISALNEAIKALNSVEVSGFPSAKAVFGSVTVLLTLIRVCLPLSYHDLPQVHTKLELGSE